MRVRRTSPSGGLLASAANGLAAPSPFGGPGAGGPYPGLGVQQPNPNDPAFQPPDLARALADRAALKARALADRAALKARALVVTREVPNVVIQTGWSVAQVRNTLQDLVVGLFDRPAQLLDTMAGDSRVRAAMRSRSGGLLGRPLRFVPAAKHPDRALAKKACAAWERHWPNMHAEPALLDMQETAATLGFAYAQLLWDTGGSQWLPYLQSFNARYSWYHWIWRVHVAVTRDGMYPITGGDGHWVLHAPNGSYRGWLRGALWALAQWWLARNYALRDWARYCERHGFPILLADTPFGADPGAIANYQSQLTQLGQESVLQLPGSVDVPSFGKYDLRYLEPRDQNWQAFKSLIEQCNDEITLSLLGQNLTTQVKEGSFAAARVHSDVRQAILETDARQLARTLQVQVLRPWAALNYDDPDLAPQVRWDVRPQEDLHVKAQTFQSFAAGIQQLRQAGFALDDAGAFAKRFGLVGLALHDVPPVQIEAQLARATGQVSSASAGSGLQKVADVEGAQPAGGGDESERGESKGAPGEVDEAEDAAGEAAKKAEAAARRE